MRRTDTQRGPTNIRCMSRFSGPGAAPSNVDDFFGPEINSVSGEGAGRHLRRWLDVSLCPINSRPRPVMTSPPASRIFSATTPLKVQAVLNEIDGKTHNGSANAPVPSIFGMNFQAVSVGQKLIYAHGTPPLPFSKVGGYKDSIGTPTDSLLQEIEFADRSVGRIDDGRAQEKWAPGLDADYYHRQARAVADRFRAPSSRFRRRMIQPRSSTHCFRIQSRNPVAQIGPTEDGRRAALAEGFEPDRVGRLDARNGVFRQRAMLPASARFFWGPSMGLMYNLAGLPPNGDPRTPDIIVTPNIGVIYSGSAKKAGRTWRLRTMTTST